MFVWAVKVFLLHNCFPQTEQVNASCLLLWHSKALLVVNHWSHNGHIRPLCFCFWCFSNCFPVQKTVSHSSHRYLGILCSSYVPSMCLSKLFFTVNSEWQRSHLYFSVVRFDLDFLSLCVSRWLSKSFLLCKFNPQVSQGNNFTIFLTPSPTVCLPWTWSNLVDKSQKICSQIAQTYL